MVIITTTAVTLLAVVLNKPDIEDEKLFTYEMSTTSFYTKWVSSSDVKDYIDFEKITITVDISSYTNEIQPFNHKFNYYWYAQEEPDIFYKRDGLKHQSLPITFNSTYTKLQFSIVYMRSIPYNEIEKIIIDGKEYSTRYEKFKENSFMFNLYSLDGKFNIIENVKF